MDHVVAHLRLFLLHIEDHEAHLELHGKVGSQVVLSRVLRLSIAFAFAISIASLALAFALELKSPSSQSCGRPLLPL